MVSLDCKHVYKRSISSRIMSDFSRLLPLKVEDLKETIQEQLDLGARHSRDVLVSHLTMLILRGLQNEMKLNTYRAHRTMINTSLEYNIKKKKITFRHNKKTKIDVERELKRTFKPYKLRIRCEKKDKSPTRARWAASDRDEGPLDEHLRDEVKKLAANHEMLWNFMADTMKAIEDYTTKKQNCIEYKLMALMTFLSCGRSSDLINLNPRTFRIQQNRFLGYMIQASVTETKTREPRRISFFPLNWKYDPIVILHDVFRGLEPIDKNISSNRLKGQTHQFLRTTLRDCFSAFVKKRRPHEIYGLQNGAKSHLGRHLMASYMTQRGLRDLVADYGNWSTPSSELQKQSKVANKCYIHVERNIPDYLYGFLSSFYQKLEGNRYELIDPGKNPREMTERAFKMAERVRESDLQECYPDWFGVVATEVLAFVYCYHIVWKAKKRGQNGSIEQLAGPAISSEQLHAAVAVAREVDEDYRAKHIESSLSDRLFDGLYAGNGVFDGSDSIFDGSDSLFDRGSNIGGNLDVPSDTLSDSISARGSETGQGKAGWRRAGVPLGALPRSQLE